MPLLTYDLAMDLVQAFQALAELNIRTFMKNSPRLCVEKDRRRPKMLFWGSAFSFSVPDFTILCRFTLFQTDRLNDLKTVYPDI